VAGVDELPQWEERCAWIEGGRGLLRQLEAGASASAWHPAEARAPSARLEGEVTDWRFEQRLGAGGFPLYLFGAGHVAQALVRQMLPLGAAITWVDTRDEAFDGQAGLDGLHHLAPGRLRTLLTDTPEAEIAQAPAGSFFLIMTHSHTLDFSLCEAVFQRRDFAYFGLIGSGTKRASFEGRLKARGLEAGRLGEMTCPIGIPGIPGKAPAEIALAVGAELMQVRYAHQLLKQAGQASRPHNTLLPE
jgi:xanthine dehydrogenase accessory factor